MEISWSRNNNRWCRFKPRTTNEGLTGICTLWMRVLLLSNDVWTFTYHVIKITRTASSIKATYFFFSPLINTRIFTLRFHVYVFLCFLLHFFCFFFVFFGLFLIPFFFLLFYSWEFSVYAHVYVLMCMYVMYVCVCARARACLYMCVCMYVIHMHVLTLEVCTLFFYFVSGSLSFYVVFFSLSMYFPIPFSYSFMSIYACICVERWN